MNLKTPLKTSFAVLAVAASLVSASTAWSQSGKRQAARDKVNAARRETLSKLKDGLQPMCDLVHNKNKTGGWGIKTPNPPTGAEQGEDRDMPDWTDASGQKETFRANLDVTRKACDVALAGLSQLTKEGVALYPIPLKPAGGAENGVWGELTDGLAEAVNHYDGSTLGGEKHYTKRIAEAKGATAKADVKFQLVLDEAGTLSPLVNDATVQADRPQPSALQQALKAIEPKKPDAK